MIMLVFIFGVVATLFTLYVITDRKDTQSKNNVHFYVARDKDETLWLFLGKPIRSGNIFIENPNGIIILSGWIFDKLKLNKDDYINLKWEDEPQEVFIKL